MNKDDVTMENCIDYIAAIGEAVKRDYAQAPMDDRVMAIRLVAASLGAQAQMLADFSEQLVKEGKADPLTEDQVDELLLTIRSAVTKKKPES